MSTNQPTAAQPIDIDKLEALAIAVEGVEFHAEGFEQIEGKGQFYGGLIMSSDGETIVAQCVLKHWADFIVAANPATILALIPQLRAQLPAKAVAYELPEALTEVRAKFRGEWDYAEAGGNYYTAQQVVAAFEAGSAALARQQPAASGAVSKFDGPIDANKLEAMAKEMPDECFLTGRGVLKLTGVIRQLEAEARAASGAGEVAARIDIDSPEFMEAISEFCEQASCEVFDKVRYGAARANLLAQLAAAPAAPHAQAEPVAVSAAGLEGLTDERLAKIFEAATSYPLEDDDYAGVRLFARAIAREVLATQSAKQGTLYAAPVPKEAEQAAPAAVTETFAAWLAREMPAGTVISDPAWWASRILRATQPAAPAVTDAALDVLADAKGGA